MRCKIPEISWHNRDPVLSVDIQSKSGIPNTYRLASGGTDAHVLIWHLSFAADDADIELSLAADLTRHQRAVNCVKWSPNDELLASGDDESVVFIWKQKPESEPVNIVEHTNEQDKEVWIALKVLRGHMEDVYDLSWAPNSQFLVSGSVDNSAMIWDVHKGKSQAILNDHKGFVQGVAWDPRNQYIATLSTDRYLRIFDIQTRRVLHRINKCAALPVPKGHELHERRVRLYHDDTLQTFFRRLCFTPDGTLLLTPAGIADYEGATRPLHMTYAYGRFALRQPAIALPCPDQYTVAVHCCPLLYTLRPYNAQTNPPTVPLPYRMIFAVATRSSVYFYDTQQRPPFAVISNIHYTRLTDVTWSSDGRIVVVSSTDGFCSLITFEAGELGEVYEGSEEVFSALAGGCEVRAVKKTKKQKENQMRAVADDVTTPVKEKRRSPLGEKRTEDVQQTVGIPKQSTVNTEKKRLIEENKEEAEIKEKAVQQDLHKSEVITLPTLPADIVIDKEILSVAGKFESPEKKRQPATPIMVRRHPRTPNSGAAAPSGTTPTGNLTKSASKQTNTKHATPIAVRRTPRALLAKTKATDVATPMVSTEEALDAWPVPLDQQAKTEADTIIEAPQPTKEVPIASSEITNSERTEDIRLVYEDTVEEVTPAVSNATETTTKEIEIVKENKEEVEAANINAIESATVKTPQAKQETPNNKTPRRVALKTISTPKSKKKLL